MQSTSFRETFQTSRNLDFLGQKNLAKQVGHGVEEWPLVILKELVDNALDACEDAGASAEPRVTVKVDDAGISVADNGPGIPDATISGVVNFDVRVSSREAWVSPTRGAQGNALKTLLAMPHALCPSDPGELVVSTPSAGHILSISGVDQVEQQPKIRYVRDPDLFVKSGTTFTVPWPASNKPTLLNAKGRFFQIANAYAWLNPHLTISLDWFGAMFQWEATNPTWSKWRPSDPTCLWWYTDEAFEKLAAACIRQDRTSSPARDRTVREFLSMFRGMTGTAKQSPVLKATGLSGQSMSTLMGANGQLDRGRLAKLLKAARGQVGPIKPKQLGVLGREHLRSRVAAEGGDLQSFRYAKAEGVTAGNPWVIETAFAPHLSWYDPSAPRVDRRLIAGVNFSPGILNPFRDLGVDGLDALLMRQELGDDQPGVVFVHMASPRVEYVDHGKSSIVMGSAKQGGTTGRAVSEGVTYVTRDWAKQRRAEEKNQAKEWRRQEAMQRGRRRSAKERVRDVSFELMPEAWRRAAGPIGVAAARQLMYAIRGDILRLTGLASLDDRYFTQKLLPDFIRLHPEITKDWDVVYDPRGNLKEPHTDHNVRLGTVDVREYLGFQSTPPRGGDP